jgi:hypothetical protein
MTYKEIDEKINHYEEELEWGVNFLKQKSERLIDEKDDQKIISFMDMKMKMEFFCFVTTSYTDLLCVYKNLKRSKSEWEKFYNIKIAYLVIYESINTYHQYKKEIYKTISKEKKDEYSRFFDMLSQELAEFKYEYDYDNVMAKIRNKSSAHYDKAFLTYYTSYELLNKKEAGKIIHSFLDFINPLHYFSYGLFLGELDPILFFNS